MQNLTCLVPLTNGVSGTEYIVKRIAQTLHQQGKPVALVAPNYPDVVRYAECFKLVTKNIAYIGPMSDRNAMAGNMVAALKIFRTWKPRQVHFHCPHYRWGLETVLAAGLARVPCIIRTEHNPILGKPGFLESLLLRLADQTVSTFTYVSEGNQHRFEQMLPYRRGRGHVICNGIDPERFVPDRNPALRQALRAEFGFPPDAFVAVYIGSFGGRRSLEPVFKAFRKLLNNPKTAAKAKKWRVLIIGTGPESEQKRVRDLGIEPFVYLAGRRSNIEHYLPHCDLFVSASHFEGMSMSILEAWASGVPVLATQVDGLSDVIGKEQVDQFMVAHEDVESYANAWYEFMAKESQRHLVHERATKVVRTRFSEARMVEEYHCLYEILR